MQTQIKCPNCGTPYAVDVQQVIDVGREPQLKEMLLAGQLNFAVCPTCGAGGQLTTPILYHDPKHELFMMYVPSELNMDPMQREAMIGQMTRQVIERTPQEQRRAYMFQPQQMLTMQSFMERVLETEGVTKEMLDRQKKQAELLNTLMKADADVVDYLLKERIGEIDETFFAMMRQYIETLQQTNDDARLIPLLNLQARLMTETAAGRRLERRQIAMHKFSREAQKEGGLSPQLLLRHVIANQEDRATVDTLIQSGLQALTYEFFAGLSDEIDAQQAAGNTAAVTRLSEIRNDLLQVQADMQQQSQTMLLEARDLLELLIQAPDTDTAVKTNMQRIDDVFMYVLSAEISHAEQSHDDARLQALTEIHSLIIERIENQAPPEIRLINQLLQTEDAMQQAALLDNNQDLLSTELLQVMDLLSEQLEQSGRTELSARLRTVKAEVTKRVPV